VVGLESIAAQSSLSRVEQIGEQCGRIGSTPRRVRLESE